MSECLDGEDLGIIIHITTEYFLQIQLLFTLAWMFKLLGTEKLCTENRIKSNEEE